MLFVLVCWLLSSVQQLCQSWLETSLMRLLENLESKKRQMHGWKKLLKWPLFLLLKKNRQACRKKILVYIRNRRWQRFRQNDLILLAYVTVGDRKPKLRVVKLENIHHGEIGYYPLPFINDWYFFGIVPDHAL